MSRVDTRVMDSSGRMVTGLGPKDFVLKIDGKEVPVRNFANENTPLDILLLLDVSGSMEPHVERIASASEQAMRVLGNQDRIAIMVFDTRTRVRLPFRGNQSDVTRELNRLLRSESFNGGTRITSALMSAARYVEEEARPEARHAIVILTDDMTQDGADEGRVESSLRKAGATLSFLQAPYEEQSMGRGGNWPGGGRRRGTWGSGGGWPGGGGGWPGGGPIGFPGGGGGPSPVGDRSHSAGTETIAHDSGGDTFQVNDAAALRDTLERLRQRYALYFYMPEGSTGGGRLQVGLAEMASIRYHDAEIESRRVFMTGGAASDEPATVTRVRAPMDTPATASSESTTRSTAVSDGNRRSRAVNEDSGPRINSVGSENSTTDGGGSTATDATVPATSAAPSSDSTPRKGGWPKANDKSNQQ